MNTRMANSFGDDQALSLEEKLERAKSLIPASGGLKRLLPISSEKWAGVLAELDEEKIDDLLLLLGEEAEMAGDIEKKRLAQHAENEKKYTRRLEDLQIRMEEISNNPDA
jgi:hypothetical protein